MIPQEILKVLHGDRMKPYHILAILQRGSKAHGFDDSESDEDYAVIVLPKLESLVSGEVPAKISFVPEPDIVVSTLQHVMSQLSHSPNWVDNILVPSEFVLYDSFDLVEQLKSQLRFSERLSKGFEHVAQKYKDIPRKYEHYMSRSQNDMNLPEGEAKIELDLMAFYKGL